MDYGYGFTWAVQKKKMRALMDGWISRRRAKKQREVSGFFFAGPLVAGAILLPDSVRRLRIWDVWDIGEVVPPF